jgi:hypothetical protein
MYQGAEPPAGRFTTAGLSAGGGQWPWSLQPWLLCRGASPQSFPEIPAEESWYRVTLPEAMHTLQGSHTLAESPEWLPVPGQDQHKQGGLMSREAGA